MNLYRNESNTPKWDAQRNLSGRTHYVDDDTLRFHKSRVLYTAITDGGLLFALVESYQVDSQGTSRAFRPVIFDVFGNTINRPKLEDGLSTSKAARSAMWDTLNSLDAFDITEKAIQTAENQHKREMEYMREDLAELQKKVA